MISKLIIANSKYITKKFAQDFFANDFDIKMKKFIKRIKQKELLKKITRRKLQREN